MRRVLLILIAGLALAEAGLRWGIGLGDPPRVVRDARIEYRLIPDQSYRRFGNEITINSHGMRAPDHPATAPENGRRVLLVGDSVVYGNHALDQSETIAAQARAVLAQAPALASCVVQVMPAAASSWGPPNQEAFLQEVGLLDADAAFVLLSAHDLYDIPTFGGIVPYRIKPSWGGLGDARQIFVERVFPSKPHAIPPPEIRRVASLAALDRMATLFKDAQIPATLVYHPTTDERVNGIRDERDVFSSWAAGQGWSFSDLSEVSLSAADYEDHIHPNAKGATKIAGLLMAQAQVLLPPCKA